MASTSGYLVHVAPVRLRETTAVMPTANEHPIRVTPNPKRLRASIGGRVVADTDRALLLSEELLSRRALRALATSTVPRSEGPLARLAAL